MKKLCLFLSLLISTCIYAAPADEPFPLQGGSIPPGGYLEIKLYDLPEKTNYNVHCDILNPNYQKRYPIVLSFCFYPQNPASETLNGQPLIKSNEYTEFQGTLTENSNPFEATQFYAGARTGMIRIYNLDVDDTATVQNCYAEYSTPKK